MGDDRSDFCKTCHCSREAHVNRATGRYHVTLPSGCPTKDACEREIMRGFEYEPDLQKPKSQ